MNKLKICLLVPVILLYALCGYSTTKKWAPSVINVTRINTNPTAASSVNFLITFSEAVTGVNFSAFSVTTSNGITGAFASNITGSGTTYIVSVNTGTGEGTLRLDVNGYGITPAVVNIPYLAGPVYTIDRTPPAGSISINNGLTYTNDPTVSLSITGSDTHTPLQMRFSINSGPWTPYEPFAATKSLTLTPGEGTKTVSLQLLDVALNSRITSDNIVLDQTAPNTTFTGTPPGFSDVSTATFTFTSTENGGTFEGSLDGAAFTPVTSPLTFTGLAPGNHTLEVRAIDQAGNADATPAQYSWEVDQTPPVVSTVYPLANGYYKEGDILTFSVEYNEVMIVGTAPGVPYLEVNIGGTSRFATYHSGSNSTILIFRYTVAAGDMDMDGVGLSGSVFLNGNTINDRAGNNSNLALNNVPSLAGVFVNTASPTVALSTTAGPNVNAPFSVTATFSEAVTGLTVADFNISNTTVSNLQTTDNITYTLLLTPATEGAKSISLPASSAFNIGGNGNTVSNTLNFLYDVTPPAINSVSMSPSGDYNIGDVFYFTVHYSEIVNVNTTNGTPYLDAAIGGTTYRASYLSGSGSSSVTFTYTVLGGELETTGVGLGANILLNGGTIRDEAGNNALITLQNIAGDIIKVYGIRPTVTLSTTAASPVNGPYTLTVTFSEAVTGFVLTDLAATNATLSNLQTTNNITYTLVVWPVADGPVSVQLPVDKAINVHLNGNAASNLHTINYNKLPPVITAVDVPANGYYKENGVLTFTVHTSEAILGSGAPYLEVLIGPAIRQAGYVSGLGTNALTFSYVVQDGDMDMGGIALGINLIGNNATLKDAAGKDLALTLQNIGNTFSVRVNTSRPTATISTTAAARVNAAYPITITFSEAVTGFSITDLTVTNATASNLQTTNNITYTTLITPAADGAVTIQLPADKAVNIGANGNAISNLLSNTYDHTAPVIGAGQTFNVMEKDAVGIVVGNVAATEAAGTLQNWAIANDPTGGAFAISANGTITVKDVALLNSQAGTTVSLSITVSDGLNTSVVTSLAVAIKAVNKAPAFDVVGDKEVCITTATQTFAVTGATATEAGQTFDFTINADQPIFDALTIDAAGVVSYKLKTTATGRSNITIIIKDNGDIVNGGVDVFQRTFAINVNSLPVVSISSNKGTNVSKGAEVVLTASGAATYNWGTATGAVFTVRPQANTTYSVTGASAAGCPATAQITINIIEDYKVDAGNFLTPNGDGINDKWVIRNIDSYPNNELKIFDRSGRMVYQRRNYSNDWDGTMNGRKLTEGTYYYILTIDGSGTSVKGYITLISDQK